MYEHFGNIELEDVPTPSPQVHRSSMNQTTITQM